MSRNTQFPVAVHILIALALRNETLTSEQLAWSVDTNASMVRRILGSLKRAGLVDASPGRSGGVRLARDARRIRLVDVLNALSVDSALAVHAPNPKCPLGAVVRDPLLACLAEADGAARRVLARRSVQDVARETATRMVARGQRGILF